MHTCYFPLLRIETKSVLIWYISFFTFYNSVTLFRGLCLVLLIQANMFVSVFDFFLRTAKQLTDYNEQESLKKTKGPLEEEIQESLKQDKVRSREEEEPNVNLRGQDEENINETEERGNACVDRSIQVLDGDMPLGSVQWRDCRAETARRVQVKSTQTPSSNWFTELLLVETNLSCCLKSLQQSTEEELDSGPTFDSARSLKSFSIQATEEVMQHSAEVLSRAGFHQFSDTDETVRKMAAMKTESVPFSFC